MKREKRIRRLVLSGLNGVLRSVAALVIAASMTPGPVSAQGQGQNISIESMATIGERLLLRWSGGAPPFLIERSDNLIDWESEMTVANHQAWIATSSPNGFIRISDNPPATPKGNFVGTMQVGQGEFHAPLEIHRLKSFWNFYLPPGNEKSNVPSEYFENLIVEVDFLDRHGENVNRFSGTFSELPSGRVRKSGQTMLVQWIDGSGLDKRTYTLEIAFRYSLSQPRNETIHLSDPQWELTCRYASPNHEMVFWPDLKTEPTSSDSAFLYELEDQDVPNWFNRKRSVVKKSASLSTAYTLGIPNYGGSPAFIFKTPVLLDWKNTTLRGLSEEPIILNTFFSQTYQPGHHNFWENFIMDPLLESSTPIATLISLRERNIRYIYALAGDEVQQDGLAYVGFDGKVTSQK